MPLNQLFKNVVRLPSGEYRSDFAELNAFCLERLEGMMTFRLFDADGDRPEELHQRSRTFRKTSA
jgi:ABC-type transport system involved in cytochrome bd biosynthesis fused ATPase/permease subunit